MMSGRGLGHTGAYARQARVDSGFRVNLSLDEMRVALLRGRLRHDRPDRTDCSGRPEALRLERRHRNSREYSLNQRLDHEQENRGRHRRSGSRCQDRERRLHEDRVRLSPPGRIARRHRQRVGRQERGHHHADGLPLGCAVGNGLEVVECLGSAQGPWTGRSGRSVGGACRSYAGPGGVAGTARRRSKRFAAPLPQVPGWNDFGGSSNSRAATLTSSTTMVYCRRARTRRGERRHDRVFSPGWMPHWSAVRLLHSGPEGIASKTPIDHAAGIMVVVKPGVELRAGDPVLELHYRDRARLGSGRGSGVAGDQDRRQSTRSLSPSLWARSADECWRRSS